MGYWTKMKWVKKLPSALTAALALAGCTPDGTREPVMGDLGNNGTMVAGSMAAPLAGSPGVMNPTSLTPMDTPTPGGDVTTPGAGSPSAGGAIPCAVDDVIRSGCQGCHGASPIGGAPMSLVTRADFMRDYTVVSTTQLRGQTMKLYELARIRINREMGTTPMPQGVALVEGDKTALNDWLSAGAPAGTACSPGDQGPTEEPSDGSAGTNGGSAGAGDGKPGSQNKCDAADAFEPLVARDGETCWGFKVHGRSGASDTSKFNVPVDESYSQFYYSVPWPAGSLATRFGSDFDNLPVLHHWLMFSSDALTAPGTVSPNVTGTTLGENAELVAGWAVGGCTTTYPDDVGVKLPERGMIMVQWHHYNFTGSTAQDGSTVQICTVPEGARPNVAGLTFLGTEALIIPPGGKSDAVSTCWNDSGAPITILGFTPHMHTIGTNMKSVVDKADGSSFELFNEPFVFDQQVNYMLDTPYVLQPGDSITSTCTFTNDGVLPVTFGQSTGQEMCYQFTLAYPHGALNNGVISLIGATNTCW